MLWSPLTMTDAWDFQAREAGCGHPFSAEIDLRLEISGNTRDAEKKSSAENKPCAMRSQNDNHSTDRGEVI